MRLNDLKILIPCTCCGKPGHIAYDGTKMRTARQASGLGLREMARRLKISPMTLSRIEQGPTTEYRALQFLRALKMEKPDDQSSVKP